jgi:amino acid adenylation domain-containing protein
MPPPNQRANSAISLPPEFTPQGASHFYVPDLVNSRAVALPRAIAVAADSTILSYAELNRQANQLAHCLKSAGVGRERLVGLHLKRSPAFIVAALATLKAGAAYLPLDPDSPRERSAYMLRDSGVSVVVTSENVPEELGDSPCPVVNIDRDASSIGSQSVEAPGGKIHPEDLAYVIYTSGSSGRPKGVEVTHANLMNLVRWHIHKFQVRAEDRASFLAALGFDAAVWELWPYLTAGASVHLPNGDVGHDPVALRDWLIEKRITMSFAATPIAERLLTLDWAANSRLKILLTGADTLRRRPASTSSFTLVNNYGPTECTVVATSGTVASSNNGSRPSIGLPIDNTVVYILDEARRALPQGQAGELYVGGAGVARGYRNQPALSAERFVQVWFGSNHERLYRTGDLGRELPNGEIEFLGRVDEQLKIRGFRIEPNEIITALNSCPGVRASTVVAREEPGGEKRLLAYVVLAPNSAKRASALRDHLARLLPDYMIPAVFIELGSIPVTANGKVDRASLPEPTSANQLRDDSHVAPRSLVEQRLAALIAPLLRVERIGVNDNFFLLGGHSLLGTQLITRIRDVFGVDLPLLSLFDHPTLAGMSGEIELLILAKIAATSREDLPLVTSLVPEKTER